MTRFRADLVALLRPHMQDNRFPSALVQDVDALLDRAGVPRDVEVPVAAAPVGGLQAGPDGEKLIKEFEGFARDIGGGRVHAYPDPGTGGKPWTIGWGSTGPDIGPDTVWTVDQCAARFTEHLRHFSASVAKLLEGAPTSQGEFDAMVSLAYNIGTGNFSGSTLLKKHRAGDHAGAALEFAKWNKAAGRVLPGLVRRRAAEAALYSRG